tara:strand:- start:902 stop:1507 length:606 start_codon:yes stop_codon:yes gene_type:complete
MKLVAKCLILFVFLSSCDGGKQPLKGDTQFQKGLNAVFKDASTSPLKEKDRKEFDALEFFKYDSAYVVEALFTRTEHEVPFKMKTSTDSLIEYIKYGELEFSLKNERFKLNAYQDEKLTKEDGYGDYLFLPFSDETNGLESYGGGRYLDLKIPKSDTVVIDFNSAFNPYCAYNEKYSCPIVPRENYLKTRIEAGVKAFGKH